MPWPAIPDPVAVDEILIFRGLVLGRHFTANSKILEEGRILAFIHQKLEVSS